MFETFQLKSLKNPHQHNSEHLGAKAMSRVFFDPDFCLLSLFTFLFSSQNKNHLQMNLVSGRFLQISTRNLYCQRSIQQSLSTVSIKQSLLPLLNRHKEICSSQRRLVKFHTSSLLKVRITALITSQLNSSSY